MAVLKAWDVVVTWQEITIKMRVRAAGLSDLTKEATPAELLNAFEGELEGVQDEAGKPVEFSPQVLVRLMLHNPELAQEFERAMEQFTTELGNAAPFG